MSSVGEESPPKGKVTFEVDKIGEDVNVFDGCVPSEAKVQVEDWKEPVVGSGEAYKPLPSLPSLAAAALLEDFASPQQTDPARSRPVEDSVQESELFPSLTSEEARHYESEYQHLIESDQARSQLPATSDRRRFLEAVAGSTRPAEAGQEQAGGPREVEQEGHASSVGSSLAGESVTSWLATTAGSLDGAPRPDAVATPNLPCPRPPRHVSFSPEVQEVPTYSAEEYDRSNEGIDPTAASLEWEMEKRLAAMDTMVVQLERGPGGLGLAIVGLGVEAGEGAAAQERLGIYVKAVTAGGVAERDGRVRVGTR